MALLVLAACLLGCGAAPPPPVTGVHGSWSCGEVIGDLWREVLEALECEKQRWRDHYYENHEVAIYDVTLDADVERWIADVLRQLALARPAPASRDAIERLVGNADLGAHEDEETGVYGLVVGKTMVSGPPLLVDVIPECGEGGCAVSVRSHARDPTDGVMLDEPDWGSHLWTQACELCLPRAVAVDEAYWQAARIGDLVGFDRQAARKEACGDGWLGLAPERCPLAVEVDGDRQG